MFVNFSNHPSDKWDENQRAEALKYGRIVDVPFPEVPADGDEIKIEKMADECIKNIISFGADLQAVMAQGEFTLTYKVVDGLKARGIKVLSACTEREVSEHIDKKGNKIKESVFRFVGFREY